MISYVIPYDTSKDLCKSYNREMSRLVHSKDWCVFVDGDTIFLDSHFGKKIEQIIKDNPDVRCFTATCNRVANPYQTVAAGISAGDDIRKHTAINNTLWKQYGTQLVDVTDESPISGFFIALRKDLWKRIRGFDYWYDVGHPKRGMLGIDSKLHLKVKQFDKVWMAKGIYLYHWYRGGNKDDSHLIK